MWRYVQELLGGSTEDRFLYEHTQSSIFEAWQQKLGANVNIADQLVYGDDALMGKFSERTAHPIRATLGNLPVELRNNPKAWVTIGYIPQLRGRYTASHVSTLKMQLYHNCMHVITQEERDWQVFKEVVLAGPKGNFKVFPLTGMVLGDHVEHCTVARARQIHHFRPEAGDQRICFRCSKPAIHFDHKIEAHEILLESTREQAIQSNSAASLFLYCIQEHVQNGLKGLWESSPAALCVVDLDHFYLEGLGRSIYDWTKAKMEDTYTAKQYGQIKSTIDERFGILGRSLRTGKFINGVMKLSPKASKDIMTLMKYLPFVVAGLLPPTWVSCFVNYHILALWLFSYKPTDWTTVTVKQMEILAVSMRDHCRFLFVVFSKSFLLFKKMHFLLEIFTLDIVLHGSLLNARCAMLESMHLVEKDIFSYSNHKNLLQTFAEKHSYRLWEEARMSLSEPINYDEQEQKTEEPVAGHLIGLGRKWEPLHSVPNARAIAHEIKKTLAVELAVEDIEQCQIQVHKTTMARNHDHCVASIHHRGNQRFDHVTVQCLDRQIYVQLALLFQIKIGENIHQFIYAKYFAKIAAQNNDPLNCWPRITYKRMMICFASDVVQREEFIPDWASKKEDGTYSVGYIYSNEVRHSRFVATEHENMLPSLEDFEKDRYTMLKTMKRTRRKRQDNSEGGNNHNSSDSRDTGNDDDPQDSDNEAEEAEVDLGDVSDNEQGDDDENELSGDDSDETGNNSEEGSMSGDESDSEA